MTAAKPAVTSRRPYSRFDFLGGRASATRTRRLRRLIAVGVVAVAVVAIMVRAGLSLYGTTMINNTVSDIRVQDQLVLNQIAARLQSGATEEQMRNDLKVRREVIAAALDADAAAASFLSRVAPLGSDRIRVVGVDLVVQDVKPPTAGEAGVAAPPVRMRARIQAQLSSQRDVAAWVAELEQFFPEVAWGFPQWGKASDDGSITVTVEGPVAAVDPERRNQVLNELQPPEVTS